MNSKAQEVERAWTLTLIAASPWTAKRDQPGLIGMQCEAVFRHALLEHPQNALGVCFMDKSNYEIVTIADQACVTRQDP